VRRPANWEAIVQQSLEKDELAGLQTSVRRGRPFGSADWVRKTAGEMGLDFTLRDRGRPKKSQK
jgi:putative transposase